jgi:hypothetical protein
MFSSRRCIGIASIVLLVLAMSLVGGAHRAAADIIPGQYSLELSGSESNGVITLNVAIEHDGQNPGKYQAVEWYVDYAESRVDAGSVSAGSEAPSQCAYTNDDGDRLLLGCLDLEGDNLDFSGVAFVATFYCLAPGSAEFAIGSLGSDTFVTRSSGNAPVHTHDVTIDCSETSPQATPPATPPAGAGTTPAAPTTSAVAQPTGGGTPGATTPGATTPGATTPGATTPGATTAPSTPGTTAPASVRTQAARTSAAAGAAGTPSTRSTQATATARSGSTGTSEDNSGGGTAWWVIALLVVVAAVCIGGVAALIVRRRGRQA